MSKKKRSSAQENDAYAYTPGLKIQTNSLLSKERILPILGRVLVNEGEIVDNDATVAEMEVPSEPVIVKAALTLNVEPQEVKNYMVKNEGDKVKRDDVVSKYVALFGLINRSVKSPIDGTIENVGASGWIMMRPPPITIGIKSYIPGKVAEVFPGKGVRIETRAAFIQGIFGIGGERHGRIKVLVDSPGEILTSEKITSANRGEIIVGGSFIGLDTLKKAIECGVSGIVVGGFDGQDLTKFLGYEMGVAITGDESVDITLVITEGFGKMSMSNRTFNLLKQFEGRDACVSGVTQIRAGVIRPEVIIPHEDLDGEVSAEEISGGMKHGTPVRVIREPYFGSIGKIVGLPPELYISETESKVRIAEVEVDGRVVKVPRANLEIIET